MTTYDEFTDVFEPAEFPLLELVPAPLRAGIVSGWEVTDVEITLDVDHPSHLSASGRLVIHEPFAIDLPSLPVEAIGVGDPTAPAEVGFELSMDDTGSLISLDDLPVFVTLDPTVLRDVETGLGSTVTGLIDLWIGSATDYGITASTAFFLPPAYVAGTEISVSASEVQVVGPGGDTPDHVTDPDFWGLTIDDATAVFPAEILGLSDSQRIGVALDEVAIGTTGFSGHGTVAFDPPFGASVAGFGARLHSASIQIADNVPTAVAVSGDVRLDVLNPNGDPWWVAVDLAFGATGGFTMSLAPVTTPVVLAIPDVFALELTGLRIEVTSTRTTVWLTGRLQLLVPGVVWPLVDVDDVGVDSDGRMRAPPAGITFATPMIVERDPVRFELSSLTFGQPDETTYRLELALAVSVAGGTPVAFAADMLAIAWTDDGAVSLSASNVSATGPAIAVSVAAAGFDIDDSSFALHAAGVDLGLLGTVDSATLSVVEVDGPTGPARRVSAATSLRWDELAARLAVPPDVASAISLPPDGTVEASLVWSPTTVHVDLAVAAADLDGLFSSLPATHRPEVADAALRIVADYPLGDPKLTDTNAAIDATVSAAMRVRPPAVPDLDWLSLDTSEWLDAAVTFGTSGVSLSLGGAIGAHISIPGTGTGTGTGTDPMVDVLVTSVGFSAGAAGTGSFSIAGDVTLTPVALPPSIPLAGHVNRLLDPVPPLSGTITGSISIDDQRRVAASVVGTFTDLDVDLDVLGMMSGLTATLAPPISDGAEVALDLNVGASLRSVGLELTADGDVTFGLGTHLRAGALTTDFDIALGTEGLVAQIDELRVPLELPVFPLGPADFNGLVTAADWDQQLTQLAADLDAHPGPPDHPDRAALASRAFLFAAIDEVRRRLPAADSPQRYAAACSGMCGALRAVTSGLHVDTDLMVVFTDVGLTVPFSDPRGIELGGSMGFTGLADDDPLKPLEALDFGLGIGPDMVFARLRLSDDGEPITLPPIGDWSSAELEISDLSIGYGYTRNSLAVRAAGSLTWPPELIELIDTTSEIGAGIRIPQHNRIGFRLDLIPVTLGPIEFVLPLIELDVDLRTPGVPAMADPSRCLPEWDGLSVHVPGVIEADLKQFAVGPFFMGVPIPNIRLDGDIDIGNAANGYRLVVNDMVILTGVAGYIGIPPLAAPFTPWFENVCVNLRLAGFEINVDLQRPLPVFSPFALFEVLGLISDPMMQIDPDGDLANTLRVSLRHGRLRLPEWVDSLAPGLARVVEKELDVTVNLATVIGAGQAVVDGARFAIDDGNQAAAQTAELTPPALLDLIPHELRKIRTELNLGGFEARGVIVVMSPSDLAAAIERPPLPPPVDAPGAGDAPDPRWRPPGLPAQGRVHDPLDTPLLSGREFDGFTAADLPSASASAGVVVGAYVRVAEGQRFRFVGSIDDTGRFMLASRAAIEPLRLTIAGIERSVPIDVDGGLRLSGRMRRGAINGKVTASGSARWKPLPGILDAELTSIEASVWSDGRFAVAADADVRLFAAALDGTVSLSESHAHLAGGFRYNAPGLIDLDLDVSGEIGPGSHVSLSGDGTVSVLDQPPVDARVTITESGVGLGLSLHGWTLPGGSFGGVSLDVDGMVDCRYPTSPSFDLQGTAEFTDVFGATLTGTGGVRRRNGAVTVWGEGSLEWQGRTWAQGRISFGSDSVEISGRTSLTVDLTPSGDIAGMDLAQLVFAVDLGGSFRMRPSANGPDTARIAMDGGWTLGVRLPGNDGQVVPIAAQELSVGPVHSELDVLLLNFQGLDILPLGDLGELSGHVPTLAISDDSYLVRLRGYDEFPPVVRLTAGPFDIPPGWPGTPGIDVTVPNLEITTTPITVSAPDLGSIGAHFQLRLVMIGGRLALRVVSGRATRTTFLDGGP